MTKETVHSCKNCEIELNYQDFFCPNCGEAVGAVKCDLDNILGVVQDLGTRGEKMLQNNCRFDEAILVKLKGSFGEAFVVTDKRLYVMKWGSTLGQALGSRCVAFEFGNITGIEIKKSVMSGTVEILSPATQSSQKTYWGRGEDSAARSHNVVTFQTSRFKHFQRAVNTARELVAEYHNRDNNRRSENGDPDYISELEKLAELKEKGIVTEEEFAAKKKKLLGL